MQLYGKQSKVCYKHRSIIGGAVVRIGACEICTTQVSSGVGSVPRLCGPCSVIQNQCRFCRVKGETQLTN